MEDQWHHFDAQNQVLGRLATKVAYLLAGKHEVTYAANKIAPVHVVITNSDKVVLTGRKEKQKMYRHYTGYPGGLKERSVAEQRAKDSTVLIEMAVFGMLPKNSLRAGRMKHLKVYRDDQHPHLPQLNKPTNEKTNE